MDDYENLKEWCDRNGLECKKVEFGQVSFALFGGKEQCTPDQEAEIRRNWQQHAKTGVVGNSVSVIDPKRCYGWHALFGPQQKTEYQVFHWGVNDVRVTRDGEVQRYRENVKQLENGGPYETRTLYTAPRPLPVLTDEQINRAVLAFETAVPTYTRDQVDHPNDEGRINWRALAEDNHLRDCLERAILAAAGVKGEN